MGKQKKKKKKKEKPLFFCQKKNTITLSDQLAGLPCT